MWIDASLCPVWPDFSLDISTGLHLRPGLFYHLQGANGSGKSSFLTRLLLPRLLARNDVYSLYLEQQMHFQIQAVKAYASLLPPHREIVTEQDTVAYLLEDLRANLAREERKCFVLMDESPYEQIIAEFIQLHLPHCCLVYCSHNAPFPAGREIVFEPQSPLLSKVYAPAD